MDESAIPTEEQDNAVRLQAALARLEQFLYDEAYEGDVSLVMQALDELYVLRGRIKSK